MSISHINFCNLKALIIRLCVLITFSTQFVNPGFGTYKNILRLKSISGNYSDETIIRLNSAATYDFDSNWDAYKLPNGGNTPNFYSTLKSINYSINSIPDTLTDITIPFKMIAAFTGNYSIVTTGIDSINFDPNFSVLFEDRLNSITIDLWKVSNYDFSAIAKDTSSRFYLHIKSKVVSSTPTTSTSTSPDTTTTNTITPSDTTTNNTDTTTTNQSTSSGNTTDSTTTSQNSTSNTTTDSTSNNTPSNSYSNSNNPGLTTSVNNQNNDGLIQFYQVNHQLELTFNQNVGRTTIYCYNSTGEQILNPTTINNCYGNIVLAVPASVKPGLYTVAITMNNELYYKKIFINE
jgi:hypothetical protein